MSTPDPRLTAFAYRRQRLDGSAPDALSAVEAAVAVYAANPGGPLSILARAPSVSAADVLALERDGRIVRGRAMRTSAFVMPAGVAPLVAEATARPLERFAWMLTAARVTPHELEAARDAIVRAAVEPRTARELREAAGLDHADVGRFVSYLVLRGDLVALGAPSVTSNAGRYQARDAWAARSTPRRPSTPGRGPGRPSVAPAPATPDPATPDSATPDPATSEPATRAAARAWLAEAYLRAFGPARKDDFAWWAGFTRAEAAAALAECDTVDTGAGLLLLADDARAFEASTPLPDELALAPKWDAWTMGYPLDGRARFVDREVHDRLFDGDGNGLGAVLVAGRAVGAWGHRGVNGRMEADLDLFERPTPRLREAIEARLGTIAAFLGYRALRVRDVPTIVPVRPRVRRPLA